MKLLVLGAGGVGGYFGGRLAEAGADVTFLVRGARRAQLVGEGLRIQSPFGDARLDVRTIGAEELDPSYDVVLLTCKAYDLEGAIEAIRPAVAPAGAVLPLLNGVAHIDALNAAFGRARVLGGVAKIQATLTADGVVRQLNDWRGITFGEQDGTMSARVRTLAALFAGARGVEAAAVGDIVQRMWEKLVHLSTAAAMTCLMRASVGEIVRTPDGGALFLQLFDTACAIAARNGHPPGEAFVATYRQVFSDPRSAYTTSMLRDIERRGRIEGEHIVGFMLDRAREAGLDDRVLQLAYTHLKAYEARLASGRDA